MTLVSKCHRKRDSNHRLFPPLITKNLVFYIKRSKKVKKKFFEKLQNYFSVFPDVLVAPAMMTANTDTRHYWGLSKNIYRFAPMRLNKEDIARIHGTDERMAISNYVEIVHFYNRLIRNSDQPF
jgi:acetylornithine deacetylase/succinyl-diaminopimelate desuccinylase-like protein